MWCEGILKAPKELQVASITEEKPAKNSCAAIKSI